MRILITLALLLGFTCQIQAAFAVPTAKAVQIDQFEQFERAYVEQRIGRKLKFKERVALSFVRGKAKRQARRDAKIAAGERPVDGYAVASLVCGILGFFTGFTAIAAIILGIISLGRFNRDPQFRSGKGMAIAGIILGGLLIVLILLLVLLFAAAFS